MITDPAGPRPGPLRRAATVVWLPILLGATILSPPQPAVTALLVAGLVLAALGWIVMGLRLETPVWATDAGLVALAAGGWAGVAAAGDWSTPIAFCFVAVGAAGARIAPRRSVLLFVLTAAALCWPLWDTGLITLAVVPFGLLSVLLLGMSRRDAHHRAEERAVALAAATRASEEHLRAAALAERARIARDVHDVLAHSLSALAVQLQGARLMVQRDGAPPDTVAQIERAQRLATEGLAEARRAVSALRDGAVDIAAELRALVDVHPGAALDVGPGLPDLPDPARDALLRTAQEALSNARKHAPGAPVDVRLRGAAHGVELVVSDRTGEPSAPAGDGGYGLVGMAERAALIGADLETGPTEDGWRVRLWVPVSP
ncbi:MAG: histidine kinase [Pseudonocardia sp.]|nr:histidine kinase [Pseudonocardia sp.]